MWQLLTTALLLLLTVRDAVAATVFDACRNTVNLGTSNVITIKSAARYKPGSACMYIVTAPSAYEIIAECNINVDKPQSSCTTELFYVATEADQTLASAEYFCGFGLIRRTSLFNQMIIAYTSASTQYAGNFTCTVRAQRQACDCGWSVNQKIVNGVQTGINEYPAQAALIDLATKSLHCSATIINYKHSLTAAHCLYKYQNNQFVRRLPSEFALDIGDHDFNTGSDTRYANIMNLAQIKVHEAYNAVTGINDLAILTTQSPMTWTRGVGPACLPYRFSSNSFAGTMVTAVGWGHTEFGGRSSNYLRKVALQVQSNSYCIERRRNNTIIPAQICTQTAYKDTCQQDSGGPLYFQSNDVNRAFVLGIIGYGDTCNGLTPSVNTRVSSYLSWIEANTPGAIYCRK